MYFDCVLCFLDLKMVEHQPKRHLNKIFFVYLFIFILKWKLVKKIGLMGYFKDIAVLIFDKVKF